MKDNDSTVVAIERHVVHCITSPEFHCKNWQIEGVLRMLHNVMDLEVAKDPENLIVYGEPIRRLETGGMLQKIEETLLNLEPDETMLVQKMPMLS